MTTCKTEISFEAINTDRLLEIPSSTTNQSESKSKTKTILNKSQLTNIHVKGEIRTVKLSKLGLNNFEALNAIKKCSEGSFVSRIELGENMLTSQLIGMLRKEKGLGKYLKVINLKGMKIDKNSLKREGMSL